MLNDKSEFPYFESMLKNRGLYEQFRREFDEGKLLFVDPGKRSLLYLMASNKIIHIPEKKIKNNNFGISVWEGHKIMNYTNKTRMKFTKRKKYINLIDKWKSTDNSNNSKTLKDVETELSNENSKSCVLTKFLKYIKKKFELNKKARDDYNTTYINKLKWFSYLNKRKHEDMLLNIIENEFGKEVKIIIGDWSNTGIIKYISTPNLSLKRKLKERFKVYTINEYLTSKMHYKHDVKCDNINVNSSKIVNGIPETSRIKLHAVLTYKKVNTMNGCKSKCVSGCINRDKNSVMNMERLVNHIINTGKRLPILSMNQDYPDKMCTDKVLNIFIKYELKANSIKSEREKNLDAKGTYSRYTKINQK